MGCTCSGMAVHCEVKGMMMGQPTQWWGFVQELWKHFRLMDRLMIGIFEHMQNYMKFQTSIIIIIIWLSTPTWAHNYLDAHQCQPARGGKDDREVDAGWWTGSGKCEWLEKRHHHHYWPGRTMIMEPEKRGRQQRTGLGWGMCGKGVE